MNHQSKCLAIVVAMEEEALPLIDCLGLMPFELNDKRLPVRMFRGFKDDLSIVLSYNGRDVRYNVSLMGSQPATLNTYCIIQQFSPTLIVSAGTAGGLKKKGAQIGDIFLSDSPVRFHDRVIPVRGLKEYGIGNFPVLDDPWVKQFAREHGCKFGQISSGDSLHMGAHDGRQFDENGSDVKEMEAAAVAWVASIHGVPFLALKSITDLIDIGDAVDQQFTKNFQIAIESLTIQLNNFVRFYSTLKLAEKN